MKRSVSILCGLLFILLAAAPARPASPEESFRKNFPNIRVDSFRPSAVTGLYEVVSRNQVLYYAPETEYLIFGQMVTKEGKNLTDERVKEIIARALKELPLDKAIRIGSGTHQVIEVTDPDCPFCRKGSAFLAGVKDLTRYVFFFPLAMHRDAEAKVRQIFCAEDRGKAYEEAMAGKLDDMKFTPCKSAEAEDLLRSHKEMLNRAGVSSTPIFLIDGQVVFGADIPRMERILGAQK
ncbi:MAG: DsbC family protein [Deltaproteobacteria bacterium]|nr:DsbC family protein [Deltaproteobacteria bacterium]